MADDERAQVVLAGDVPEDRGGHPPADPRPAPAATYSVKSALAASSHSVDVPRKRQSACSPTRYDTRTSWVGHTSRGGWTRRITAPVCPTPGQLSREIPAAGTPGCLGDRAAADPAAPGPVHGAVFA